MAPWQYTSSTAAAVDKLIAVATGKYRNLGTHTSQLLTYISIPQCTIRYVQEVNLSPPCCNNLLVYPEQMPLAS